MFRLVAGAIVGGAAETVNASPAGSDLVIILSAVLGGGIMAAIVSAWQFKRLGGAQHQELESHAKEMESNAANLAVSAMEKSLGQREKDLAAALARIELLEQDVRNLTVKIAKLEADLEHSNGLRAQVQQQLEQALLERDGLKAQIADLNRRVGGRRSEDDPHSTP